MLPLLARPIGFNTWDRETWEAYAERLALPADRAVREFYRQVPYDHFDQFNEHYPHLDLSQYAINLVRLQAQSAIDRVRYFNNEELDWWGDQFEDFKRRNYDYVIFQEMSRNLTAPFPPVLLDPSKLTDNGRLVYGRPLHLIEGTHRFSYLRHMVSTGLIHRDSGHEFVLLSPL